MSTPALLTDIETCPRKGYWSRNWAAQRLTSTQMLQEAMREALCAPEGDWGEVAGSAVMQLGEDRGLETNSHRVYDSVVHHAALADICTSVIRKPEEKPWLVPANLQDWVSGCYLSPDGSHLRRIVLASNWGEERKASECRSWFTLGEIAHYELPMQIIVLIIGQTKDGLRRGPFTQGFLHPMNKQLRFRKKGRATSEVFNDRWTKVMREDHAEISREKWLQAMLMDDVLPEVCFRIDVGVPEKSQLARIRDMAHRKMDRLQSIESLPEANLSTCERPPCPFRKLCHSIPESEPSAVRGYFQQK